MQGQLTLEFNDKENINLALVGDGELKGEVVLVREVDDFNVAHCFVHVPEGHPPKGVYINVENLVKMTIEEYTNGFTTIRNNGEKTEEDNGREDSGQGDLFRRCQ